MRSQWPTTKRSRQGPGYEGVPRSTRRSDPAYRNASCRAPRTRLRGNPDKDQNREAKPKVNADAPRTPISLIPVQASLKRQANPQAAAAQQISGRRQGALRGTQTGCALSLALPAIPTASSLHPTPPHRFPPSVRTILQLRSAPTHGGGAGRSGGAKIIGVLSMQMHMQAPRGSSRALSLFVRFWRSV